MLCSLAYKTFGDMDSKEVGWISDSVIRQNEKVDNAIANPPYVMFT